MKMSNPPAKSNRMSIAYERSIVPGGGGMLFTEELRRVCHRQKEQIANAGCPLPPDILNLILEYKFSPAISLFQRSVSSAKNARYD
jgi:hypothetical protein